MLNFASCEGVSLLRKITITVDDVTLDCLRALREFYGTPHSASIRLAVLAYCQGKVFLPSAQKNRPSVGWSAAEVNYYVV